MRGQVGFFDLDERPKALSAKGDALERLEDPSQHHLTGTSNWTPTLSPTPPSWCRAGGAMPRGGAGRPGGGGRASAARRGVRGDAGGAVRMGRGG